MRRPRWARPPWIGRKIGLSRDRRGRRTGLFGWRGRRSCGGCRRRRLLRLGRRLGAAARGGLGRFGSGDLSRLGRDRLGGFRSGRRRGRCHGRHRIGTECRSLAGARLDFGTLRLGLGRLLGCLAVFGLGLVAAGIDLCAVALRFGFGLTLLVAGRRRSRILGLRLAALAEPLGLAALGRLFAGGLALGLCPFLLRTLVARPRRALLTPFRRRACALALRLGCLLRALAAALVVRGLSRVGVGVLLLGAVLLVLAVLGAILGLVAGVSGTIGDEVGGQHARHVGAGRVVLTQETRQRTRRYRFQQPPRALVAGIAGLREDLGWGLAGLEVRRLRQNGIGGAEADQKQHRREAERSARHSHYLH